MDSEQYTKERLITRFKLRFGHEPSLVTPNYAKGRSPGASIELKDKKRTVLTNVAVLNEESNEISFLIKFLPLKWCCSCKKELFIEQFGQCKSYADGKNPRCRKCVSIRQKEWYLRKKALSNPDYKGASNG